MKCEDCKFWDKCGHVVGATTGKCHRYPPLPGKLEYTVFPITRDYDWCGEFSPKEEIYRQDLEMHLSELMRDPRYWRDRDPEIIKEITEGFRKLYPN